MTPANDTARDPGERVANVLIAMTAAVVLLLVTAYASADIYDKWREVLNKHNALLYVFSLDGLVLGTVACTCFVVGYALGMVKGLIRGDTA